MLANIEAVLHFYFGRKRGQQPVLRGAFSLASPILLSTGCRTFTLAEINAGTAVIPAIPGQRIQVVNFMLETKGANMAGLTALVLQSTDATPVNVASVALAALTQDAVIFPHTTNVTLGAGFEGALNAGAGLQIAKTGSNGTGATGVVVRVDYLYHFLD